MWGWNGSNLTNVTDVAGGDVIVAADSSKLAPHPKKLIVPDITLCCIALRLDDRGWGISALSLKPELAVLQFSGFGTKETVRSNASGNAVPRGRAQNVVAPFFDEEAQKVRLLL